MSQERVVYSIQKTYIIKPVFKPDIPIFTCDERIDIPTIEALPSVKPVFLNHQNLTVIPCIELVGGSLGKIFSEFNFTFETNEGVTVLPIKIPPGEEYPLVNPYRDIRYVLVLPRGATGVKSCKITYKDFGITIPHNFTFGIMPPPYNYDNVLFGCCADAMLKLNKNLRLTTNVLFFENKKLPKGMGKQTIYLENDMLFSYVQFNYPLSSEPTIHKPKITLQGVYTDFVCTLSLNKTANTVLIDLFTGVITAYDSVNGEIIQQFMLNNYNELRTLSFENFDDIDTSYLTVRQKGASVR